MSALVPFMEEIVRSLELLGSFLKSHSGMAVSGFVSALVALASLLLVSFHRRAQRYSWDTQRLLYLHGFLSSSDQMAARRWLRARKDETAWDVKEDEFADVVSAAYDQAGILLLAPGLVNSKQTKYLLRSSWGKSICEQYELIEKRERHRALRGPHKTHTLLNHFTHFGDLYRATKKAQRPSIINRILRRV